MIGNIAKYVGDWKGDNGQLVGSLDFADSYGAKSNYSLNINKYIFQNYGEIGWETYSNLIM